MSPQRPGREGVSVVCAPVASVLSPVGDRPLSAPWLRLHGALPPDALFPRADAVPPPAVPFPVVQSPGAPVPRVRGVARPVVPFPDVHESLPQLVLFARSYGFGQCALSRRVGAVQPPVAPVLPSAAV